MWTHTTNSLEMTIMRTVSGPPPVVNLLERTLIPPQLGSPVLRLLYDRLTPPKGHGSCNLHTVWLHVSPSWSNIVGNNNDLEYTQTC